MKRAVVRMQPIGATREIIVEFFFWKNNSKIQT